MASIQHHAQVKHLGREAGNRQGKGGGYPRLAPLIIFINSPVAILFNSEFFLRPKRSNLQQPYFKSQNDFMTYTQNVSLANAGSE